MHFTIAPSSYGERRASDFYRILFYPIRMVFFLVLFLVIPLVGDSDCLPTNVFFCPMVSCSDLVMMFFDMNDRILSLLYCIDID